MPLLVVLVFDGKGKGEFSRKENGWKLRYLEGPGPYESSDRIFWSDGGVHQNLTFPVQPDPITGIHC